MDSVWVQGGGGIPGKKRGEEWAGKVDRGVSEVEWAGRGGRMSWEGGGGIAGE